MEKDKHITPTIFVMHAGECTAVFPCDPANLDGHMMCYAHIGQHSGCSLGWLGQTRPATPEQFAPLLKELESLGYNIKPCRRITREHTRAFDREVQNYRKRDQRNGG